MLVLMLNMTLFNKIQLLLEESFHPLWGWELIILWLYSRDRWKKLILFCFINRVLESKNKLSQLGGNEIIIQFFYNASIWFSSQYSYRIVLTMKTKQCLFFMYLSCSSASIKLFDLVTCCSFVCFCLLIICFPQAFVHQDLFLQVSVFCYLLLIISPLSVLFDLL